MGFNRAIVLFTTDTAILLKSFTGLIFSPYNTMRKISFRSEVNQSLMILMLVFIYFWLSRSVRQTPYSFVVLFIIFLFIFILSVIFLQKIGNLLGGHAIFKTVFVSFTHTLLPTLVWFIINSLLYYFIPPPRTMSFLGKGFSVLFIAFSISVLVWKIILTYLSLRFSIKLNFYKIIYLMILYLCFIIPLSYFLYQLRFFRILFI